MNKIFDEIRHILEEHSSVDRRKDSQQRSLSNVNEEEAINSFYQLLNRHYSKPIIHGK